MDRRVRDSAAMLERILVENVVPFWHPRVIDGAGGYHLHHDAAGKSLGPRPKRLISQARTMWYFARLTRSPWGSPATREAADHGFEFLTGKLWDATYGGFYWEV